MPFHYVLNIEQIKQHEDYFICSATRIIGPQMSGNNRVQSFKAVFGITPFVCGVVWYLINNINNNIIPKKFKQIHLLWALNFLKNYSKEEVLRVSCQNPDVKTLREKVWAFVKYISQLGDQVIVFVRRLEGNTPYRCKMTVDGTDFQIRQPTLKSKYVKSLSEADRFSYIKSWYSFKFKGAGLRYEVGVCIFTGDIVWINGPFKPGIFNDIMIFRQRLMSKLAHGEQVEADKGYRGEPLHIRTPNPVLPDETRKEMSNARMRHENMNHLLKQWQCLRQIFRHDAEKHQVVFWAVAVLTQLSIDMGEKINYQVEYIGETMEEAREHMGETF